MIKYVIKERTSRFEDKKDIFAGCTAGSGWGTRRGIYDTREKAIETLRNSELYCTSIIERTFFTDPFYEVTEFYVEKEILELNTEGDSFREVGKVDEYGNYVNITESNRMIIAVSDMPEESDEIHWKNKPDEI